MTKLYFAYGSNMSQAVMRQHCQSCLSLGGARLDDYRLAFTRRSYNWDGGVADVVPSAGFTVWGVLWRVDDMCMNLLDQKEGVGLAYDRIQVPVTLANKTTVQALTYTVIEKAARHIPPTDEYLALMLSGAAEANLPDQYQTYLRGFGL